MNDVNYTLFKSLVNNQPTDYQLQVVSEFSSSSYASDGFEILHLPQQNGDLLYVMFHAMGGGSGFFKSAVASQYDLRGFPEDFIKTLLTRGSYSIPRPHPPMFKRV